MCLGVLTRSEGGPHHRRPHLPISVQAHGRLGWAHVALDMGACPKWMHLFAPGACPRWMHLFAPGACPVTNAWLSSACDMRMRPTLQPWAHVPMGLRDFCTFPLPRMGERMSLCDLEDFAPVGEIPFRQGHPAKEWAHVRNGRMSLSR